MPRRRRQAPCQHCANMRAGHEALDMHALAIHARVVAAFEAHAEALVPTEAPPRPAGSQRRRR